MPLIGPTRHRGQLAATAVRSTSADRRPASRRLGPRRAVSRRAARTVAALVVPLTLVAGPAWAVPTGTRVCVVNDPRVTESSGLAVAGELMYTVNDGGDRLRVFVLDRACRVRRMIVNPLDPYDVEDLARGRDGTLWLSDTGDNNGSRRTVALERLTDSGAATLFRFSYPDGPHDAEALLLDRAGRPYLVTKQPLGAGVYTPVTTPTSERPTPLRKVAALTFTPTGTPGGPVGTVSQVLVTGGAVAPDGSRLVLRTYTDAYVWDLTGGDVAAALRSAPSRRLALPPTVQGEAVTFSADGHSLLTSTEGAGSPIYSVPIGATAARPSASNTPSQKARATPRASGAASAGAGSGVRGAVIGALLAAGLVLGGARLLSLLRR